MLNDNFVKYSELLTVGPCDPETDKEKFVYLPLEDDWVFGRYNKRLDMLEFSEKLPVRHSVRDMLIEAGKKLKEINPDYKLWVVYGFREMRLQQKYFEAVLEQYKDQFDDELALYEFIHEKVAIPTVSGHPTGGAVDVGIFDSAKGQFLDFGTDIQDWSTDRCYYAAPDISPEARRNRDWLRELMLGVGFAPFDGEWWHYCYGDKEWAFYYKKERPLYNQLYSFDDLVFEEGEE